MEKSPVVLGINRTLDASISLMEGSNVLAAIQKERFSKKRHHWGKLGDVSLYLNAIKEMRNTAIDLIVECYSSDPEFKNLENYHDELDDMFPQKIPRIMISHHLAHAYSAFFPSVFEEAVIMVIDCIGSPSKRMTENFPRSGNPSDEALEVTSYYVARNSNIECIAKQFFDEKKDKIAGLGMYYWTLTDCLFPGEGHEGKVMGLAPLGDPKKLALPPLIVEEGAIHCPPEWLDLFDNGREKYRFFIDGTGSFQDCADLAAAGQKAFEDALIKISAWLYEKTGMTNLCYAGGCALNCVGNGVLLRESPFKNVFVAPAPNDGGTSLGCALYGLINQFQYPRHFIWQTDYLGPEPDLSSLEHLVKSDPELNVEKPHDLEEAVAKLLTNGNILGLFQGRSEFGPRALGNRSIIADPRYPIITHWINEHIKGREWFRPIAPIVLLEDANEIFEINCASAHMAYAVPVREKYHPIIPAAVHYDGTARLQTIAKEDNPFLYDLINAVKAKIGVGVILNTSFNGKGETIVETLEDAFNSFRKLPLYALVVPPYIIFKKNGPKTPLRS